MDRDPKVLVPIPKCTPPSPQILKKNKKDALFSKLLAILKEHSGNIPMVDALRQMTRFVKFMKDLVTKKSYMDLKTIEALHHCSVIMSINLAPKK